MQVSGGTIYLNIFRFEEYFKRALTKQIYYIQILKNQLPAGRQEQGAWFIADPPGGGLANRSSGKFLVSSNHAANLNQLNYY